jgi:hypothetical protein
LVTAYETTVVSKTFSDAIVVKGGQGNRGLSDSAWTNESDGFEVFCKINNLLNQAITTETGPGWRGRQLANEDAM